MKIKEGEPAGKHVVIVDTTIECAKGLAASGAAKVRLYLFSFLRCSVSMPCVQLHSFVSSFFEVGANAVSIECWPLNASRCLVIVLMASSHGTRGRDLSRCGQNNVFVDSDCLAVKVATINSNLSSVQL